MQSLITLRYLRLKYKTILALGSLTIFDNKNIFIFSWCLIPPHRVYPHFTSQKTVLVMRL